MSENNNDKVYSLLITKGIDRENQYEFYKERIDSQKDFKYIEYNSEDDEINDDLFNRIDIIVLLYGLYHDNKKLCDFLIEKSNELEIPLLLVRSFGIELVLKQLEEKADAVVGWNGHCIVDAIETLVNGEDDWIKPCDIEEEY
ncbi:MAG: nuclease [Methanobrevibacter sp.]|nr:nuclease [Methanobrevibacter sp.]